MFLKYADMWDMPLDGASEEKKIPIGFGNLAWVVIGGVFKLLFRYRIDGRENLRAFKGVSGVLLVANHTSFFDVVFMYLACRPSQWGALHGTRHPLRQRGRFDRAGALSRVGAFRLSATAPIAYLDQASRPHAQGQKRSWASCPRARAGARGRRRPSTRARRSWRAWGHAPIIPMTVRNAELVKQKGKMIRFPKITVEFGEPLLVGDFDFLPKEDRLEGCTWYAMRECFALSQRVPASEVDMAALFPEGGISPRRSPSARRCGTARPSWSRASLTRERTRKVEVVLARHAGACYGVQRALDLAVAVIDEGREVRTLGPLIHNPKVVSDLERRGARRRLGGGHRRRHGHHPQPRRDARRSIRAFRLRARRGRRDVPSRRARSGRRRAACAERVPRASSWGGGPSRGRGVTECAKEAGGKVDVVSGVPEDIPEGSTILWGWWFRRRR